MLPLTHQFLHQRPQKINSCVIPNSLEDLGRILYRNPSELCLLCATDTSATLSAIVSAPEPSGTSPPAEPEPSGTSPAICTKTVRKLVCFLPLSHRTLHKPCLLSAPEPSEPHQPSGTLQKFVCTTPFETSSAICTGTLWNFISHLHWNPPELHQPSAPEPSGISSAICTRTLRNFISFLRHNPPEPHHLHRNPTGTSSAIYPGTLRNVISHLHRNPPEPHQPSAPEPSGTLRNLLRNLVLPPHRIAPELFWAKDPIASFAVGEKKVKEKLNCFWEAHLSPLISAFRASNM